MKTVIYVALLLTSFNGSLAVTTPSGYTTRDAGSISCGQTISGSRTFGKDMPIYSYQALTDRTKVFLEGCESTHDIWLYLFDSNGNPIYNADDQRNHGDQAGCGNLYAGDITVTSAGQVPNPVPVSAGSRYYFGVGSWNSRYGDYSVTLECEPVINICGDSSQAKLGIETGAGNANNGGTTNNVYARFYNDNVGWTQQWFLLNNPGCDDFPEAGNKWSYFSNANDIISGVMGNNVNKVALHIDGCDYLFIKTIIINGVTINVNTGTNYGAYGVVCGSDMVYYADGSNRKWKSGSESSWVPIDPNALVSDPNQVTVAGPLYFVGPTRVGFDEARTYCQGQGSELASVHSQADMNKVIELCQAKDGGNYGAQDGCYIGMKMTSAADKTWVDGTPYDFSPFASGEPNRASGQSVECTTLPRMFGYYANDDICWRAGFPICNGQPTNGANAPSFGTSIQTAVYVFWLVAVLLVVNIICLTINCWKNRSKSNKKGYKVVKYDSEVTDV